MKALALHIEGNRTTISEYIERKIENNERSSERFSEIANVEAAMDFIEETIEEGSDITHHFMRTSADGARQQRKFAA